MRLDFIKIKHLLSEKNAIYEILLISGIFVLFLSPNDDMVFEAHFKHIAPIKMLFTERLDSGICFTNEEDHIRNNCHRLHIDLDEMDEMPEAIEVFSFYHFVVCIYKRSGIISQYVFPTSAHIQSVKKILKTFPKNASRLILKVGEFSEWGYDFQSKR